MKKWKRRNYFIHKSIQSRYMGMTALFIIFFSAITGWTVYVTTWITLIEKIRGEPRLYDILAELTGTLIFRGVISIIAGMVVAAAITLFISHRIAGPMFRMRRTLESMGNGIIPSRITLRKKDEFKELSLALNSAIGKAEEITAANREIKDNILKLAADMPAVKEEAAKIKLMEPENSSL